MVALMTACLKLSGQEKVLEIGTGSGYQLAILLETAREAYSVERIRPLAERAEEALARLGYHNFKIKVGDGTLGWEEHAPYDGVIVTAASPRIPESLVNQLKDRGRLVIPVGGAFGQTLMVVEKRGKELVGEEVCGCVFVPLVGKEGWKE
jgi:protein-L-isoaspartate(D-aspartate) O-methyltransferase